MDIRSIQLFAFALLSLAATTVALQTTPSNASNVCTLKMAADDAAVDLAALFAPDAEFADAGLFRNAPLLIYAMNDVARESDGTTLVDVSGVTSCVRHDDVI